MSVELTKEISPKQFAWRNDSRITQWTRQNGLISRAHHEAYWERVKTDPKIQMFGIVTGSGDNVGTCGLTDIDLIHGKAEFSLLIDPFHQGNGLGKAALKELLLYGFKHLRLNCIWGDSFEGNPALHMFKKLGFVEEGKTRQRYFKDGKYIDSYIFSILREEAEKQSWWR